MISRYVPSTLVFGLLAIACAAEPELSPEGRSCSSDEMCATGLCASRDGSPRCVTPCAPGEGCPLTTSGDVQVCDEVEGYCIRACSEGSVQGSGATREVCQSRRWVACAEGDHVALCEACGCEPFGGGVCIAGRGCVEPAADGAACAVDAECASGACYRDSQTCGAPRAMGEPCSVDAECETQNCSTDGDETRTGVCNQPLGSACRPTSGTCNRCLQWDTYLDGICSRTHCDPVDAPGCPRTSNGRVWTCEESTDGLHRCYENCSDEGFYYNCLDPYDLCRNGFCQ